jgi:putative nucleotidyltransferase with HDIG domain
MLAIRACRNETYRLWDHSVAVASTSGRLAAAMGLGAREVRLAYASGLLHDVGKTLTSAGTLFKAGPLDDDEREEMRRHPTDGAELVSELGDEALGEAVLCHHELFDGSGYPFGLRGGEIPLHARIVSVADYYEAMREARPYRPVSWGHAEVLDLISKLTEQGIFDPAIAHALPDALARPACEPGFLRLEEFF